MSEPPVLLVTCQEWVDGEPGHAALDAAFASRGVESRWVVWDDLSVDWGAAGAVAVRSVWDYTLRLGEFLGWAAGVGPTLLNGADVFRWNTDKNYLVELGDAGLPVVPTVVVDDVMDLRAAAVQFGLAVAKPRVGSGGGGIEVVRGGRGWLPPPDGYHGPWVVQPLVESVRDEGEASVFVFNGRPVSQVDKLPAHGDIRVHQRFGGHSLPVGLADETALLAAKAIATVVDLLGAEIVYGRVDMMRYDGRLVVSEIELTEPGLYLDVLPLNADPFADAVVARL